MEMKNKLFRHHKSKASIVLRNFSLSFLGIFLAFSAITIPTYFSVRGDNRQQMQASEVEVVETPNTEEENETPNEDENAQDNENNQGE